MIFAHAKAVYNKHVYSHSASYSFYYCAMHVVQSAIMLYRKSFVCPTLCLSVSLS